MKGFYTAIADHVGKRIEEPVAVEVGPGGLESIRAGLSPTASVLRMLGAVPVYRGIEIREAPDVAPGRFFLIYRCRACRGADPARAHCPRCAGAGVRRGKP